MSEIEPQHRYWSTEEQRWIYPGELPPLPESLRNLAAEGEMEAHEEAVQAYARAAILAERERCARVCEAHAAPLYPSDPEALGLLECAAAIRRGSV